MVVLAPFAAMLLGGSFSPKQCGYCAVQSCLMEKYAERLQGMAGELNGTSAIIQRPSGSAQPPRIAATYAAESANAMKAKVKFDQDYQACTSGQAGPNGACSPTGSPLSNSDMAQFEQEAAALKVDGSTCMNASGLSFSGGNGGAASGNAGPNGAGANGAAPPGGGNNGGIAGMDSANSRAAVDRYEDLAKQAEGLAPPPANGAQGTLSKLGDFKIDDLDIVMPDDPSEVAQPESSKPKPAAAPEAPEAPVVKGGSGPTALPARR